MRAAVIKMVLADDGGDGIIELTLFKLLRFALIPVLNGTVIAGDAAVNLGRLAAIGAGVLLAYNIAVVLQTE